MSSTMTEVAREALWAQRARLHGLRRGGRLPKVAPSGFISSREAAELLVVAPRSARMYMQEAGVSFVLVQPKGERPTKFWRRQSVLRLVRKRGRAQTVRDVPEGMVGMQEAADLLGVALSTVSRRTRLGDLTGQKLRVLTSTGYRERVFYDRAEIERFRKVVLPVVWNRRRRVLMRDGFCSRRDDVGNVVHAV